MLDFGFRFFFQWLAQQARVWLSTGLPNGPGGGSFFNGSPNGSAGIRFSMVRPTRLDVFQWSAQRAWTFFNGSPNGSAGIRFSMVRPTRLDIFQWFAQRVCGVGVVFQWFAQRAWTFFNGPPNAPGRFSMVRPTGLRGRGRFSMVRPTPLKGFVFQWFAQRAWTFFNGPPNAPGGVSFFNGSPNVSDFDMWRHANPLNSHTARVPCYMCYMCYMGLTRQPAELYTIHIASQHVPNMPYIAHIVQISRVQNI